MEEMESKKIWNFFYVYLPDRFKDPNITWQWYSLMFRNFPTFCLPMFHVLNPGGASLFIVPKAIKLNFRTCKNEKLSPSKIYHIINRIYEIKFYLILSLWIHFGHRKTNAELGSILGGPKKLGQQIGTRSKLHRFV